MDAYTKIIKEIAGKHFTKIDRKGNKPPWTEPTEDIYQKRQTAINNRDWIEVERLTRLFRNLKRKDKTEEVIRTLSQELSIRSRWTGIRRLKQGYIPTPYRRTSKEGQHIPRSKIAENAAKYLAQVQWGENETTNEYFFSGRRVPKKVVPESVNKERSPLLFICKYPIT